MTLTAMAVVMLTPSDEDDEVTSDRLCLRDRSPDNPADLPSNIQLHFFPL